VGRITLSGMTKGQQGEELAAQAADAVRRIVTEAESRAAEIVREAESEATKIRESAERDGAAARERAEADARGQIEAAKRALDELGGTLAAAATSALPKAESAPQETESETQKEPAPEPEPEPEPEEAAPASANGDDAAERLEAMKMAVDGKDQSAIEAALTEKFGPGDRTQLVNEVLERVAR
jgi:dsDNA-specific endonuclease/ATPase MutS2